MFNRIKYPEEKKCIDDITPLKVLLKNQGAHTESISISPELIQICNINDVIDFHLLLKTLPTTAPVDSDEYHRSTSYLNRQQPDYSCCQDQE